jgi:hypothetical protein
MNLWKPKLFGKKGNPKEPMPVILGGIRYNAPFSKPGYIEAWKLDGNEKIWEARVYNTGAKAYRQSGPRPIYIVSLKEKEGKITVINENNDEFEVSPSTRKVTRVMM